MLRDESHRFSMPAEWTSRSPLVCVRVSHRAVVVLSLWLLAALHSLPVMAQQASETAEDLPWRLQRAESLIYRLESENRALNLRFENELQRLAAYTDAKAASETDDKPDKTSDKKSDQGTDVKSAPAKASGDQASDTKKDAPAEEKAKEWFEKLKMRGYAQFRYNDVTHQAPGSAPPNHAGDGSISPDQEFYIRRARVIIYGDVNDHLYVYLQPDFASSVDGIDSTIQYGQIRDWYGDIYLDKEKVHRFRVGQSKVPYGWENLQSSQNRLPLDRNDAFNSATRNERDLGVIYYWTPQWAQETFSFVMDEGLKGSGNYGVFGFGAYNGQGGSLAELNDELHVVSRLALPITTRCGQIVEFDIQGYTGRYVVRGAPISPLGVGPAVTPLGTRGLAFGEDGQLDQRLGWSVIFYPQPYGFQAEYTIGRGPELDDSQTLVERGSLHGGYVMWNYRLKMANSGELWPYVRYQTFDGGYKSAANAPSTSIREWNYGLEWQINKGTELVCEYLITDRTNLQAFASGRSYEQFDGQVIRFQLQINY